MAFGGRGSRGIGGLRGGFKQPPRGGGRFGGRGFQQPRQMQQRNQRFQPMQQRQQMAGAYGQGLQGASPMGVDPASLTPADAAAEPAFSANAADGAAGSDGKPRWME